ncbi:unnamed protein product, partial [Tuber aestivum]
IQPISVTVAVPLRGKPSLPSILLDTVRVPYGYRGVHGPLLIFPFLPGTCHLPRSSTSSLPHPLSPIPLLATIILRQGLTSHPAVRFRVGGACNNLQPAGGKRKRETYG